MSMVFNPISKLIYKTQNAQNQPPIFSIYHPTHHSFCVPAMVSFCKPGTVIVWSFIPFTIFKLMI